MGVDIVWSLECLYRTKRQTVGEFVFFCPQTRVFLLVRPLYSDWDLCHWLPDSQALGFGINYTTSFPGPPAPREWWDFSASIITSVISHDKSLYSHTHTHTHTHTQTHTELWLTPRIKPFCCFILLITMFSDWKLFKVGVSKLCKQPENVRLSLQAQGVTMTQFCCCSLGTDTDKTWISGQDLCANNTLFTKTGSRLDSTGYMHTSQKWETFESPGWIFPGCCLSSSDLCFRSGYTIHQGRQRGRLRLLT